MVCAVPGIHDGILRSGHSHEPAHQHMLPSMRNGSSLGLWAMVMLMSNCRAASPEADLPPQPSSQSSPSAPMADAGSCWVGVLRRNRSFDDILPAHHCLEDKKLWEGASHRIGRRNVFGVGGGADSLDGKLVLVRGTVGASLADALTLKGPCPAEGSASRQFRADWMADEGGYVTTRARLQTIPYLRASSVEPFPVLQVSNPTLENRRKEHWRGPVPHVPASATVHNPTGSVWNLELLLHYEGGPGKPMPEYERRPVRVEPGQETTVAIDSVIRDPAHPDSERAYWILEDVELAGAVGDCQALTSPRL